MKRMKSGFSLLEILVVIGIIGSLVSFLTVSYTNSQKRARNARIQADLKALADALDVMSADTGVIPVAGPAKGPIDPCTQDPEVALDWCDAGLQCTDGNYTNWKGPYMNIIPKNPWGNSYIFDPDYTCYTNIPGCEGVADGTQVRALHSYGPNGAINNYTNADNVVRVLCQ